MKYLEWKGIRKKKKRKEITCNISVPNLAGESETETPASCKALILLLASPFPPEIMAPACPKFKKQKNFLN